MIAGFDIDEAALARADKIFRGESKFVAGATGLENIPESTMPEVAFAGRSNVGKSSLINAITNRKKLARASNTPGRTQQINFFDIAGMIHLVDMPGYGFAKYSREKVERWNEMVMEYLSSRANLMRVIVLVDGRHGIMPADEIAFKDIDKAGVPYMVALTKCDKVKRDDLAKVKESVEEYLKTRKGAFPVCLPTSAEKNIGISELRALLASFSS